MIRRARWLLAALAAALVLPACGTVERVGEGLQPPCNRQAPPEGCFQVIPLQNPELPGSFSAQADADLSAAAKFLKENPKLKVSLDSHTNSTGNEDIDLRRSQVSGDEALRRLEAAGVAGGQIKLRAFGAEMPMVPRPDDLVNQRVEIFYPAP